jgi:hypothetical protein
MSNRGNNGILKKSAPAATAVHDDNDDLFAGFLEAEKAATTTPPTKKRVRIAEKHEIKMIFKEDEQTRAPIPEKQLNLFQASISSTTNVETDPNDDLFNSVTFDNLLMPPPPPVPLQITTPTIVIDPPATSSGTEMLTQAADREKLRLQKQTAKHQQKRARKSNTGDQSSVATSATSSALLEVPVPAPRYPHTSTSVNNINFVPVNESGKELELASLAVPNQNTTSFSIGEYDRLLAGASTQTTVASMARAGANIPLASRTISAFINLLVSSSNNQGPNASPLVFQPLSLGSGFASRYFQDKLTGPPQRCLAASDQPNLLEMRSNSFPISRAHLMYLIKSPASGREVLCAKKNDCVGRLLMNKSGESVGGEVLAAAWFLHELPRFANDLDAFKEEMSHRMCILDWIQAALRSGVDGIDLQYWHGCQHQSETGDAVSLSGQSAGRV